MLRTARRPARATCDARISIVPSSRRGSVRSVRVRWRSSARGRSGAASTSGPRLYEHSGEFPWAKQLYRQHNTTYLIRVVEHDPASTIDLEPEGVAGMRWWTQEELATSTEQFAPPDLPDRVRTILSA